MPIHGYPGNVITANPTAPTSSVATGVWTTEQQLQAVAAGNWPMALTQISRSLRFNSADSAQLNRTFSTTGTSTKTLTFSFWVKRSTLGQKWLVGAFNSTDSSSADIFFTSSDTLEVRFGSSATTGDFITTQVFRDISSWYHIVVAVDTTQATNTNRFKLYVNGSQVTAFGTATYPSQNITTSWFNTSANNRIGSAWNSASFFDGYITEFYAIDGQALTPSSFGFNSSDTGVWSPKQYIGSYGTNGFYINFSDNSNTTAATLGKDYSGNGNNWTPNNFSVTAGSGNDSLVDSPTAYGTDTGVGGEVRGNYCTLNPLKNEMTLSNGNLAISGGLDTTTTATMAVPSTGKWYFEFVPTSMPASNANIGLASSSFNITNATFTYAEHRVYIQSGNKADGSGSVAYGASWTTSDVIGVAVDMDAGTLVFYKNNTSQGTAFSDLVSSGKTWFPLAANYGSGTFEGNFNFGQRAFAYTAPSGFKALCTTNLPTPTIGATSTTQANDYFNAVTYTGNGTSLSVTGVGFQPDLIWIKDRSNARAHVLQNAIAGFSQYLQSNATDAETTASSGVTAVGSDGFTVGTQLAWNSNTETYVAWNWNAGGSTVTNTSGTISAQVRANTTSGFSIVTATAPSAAAQGTVGHGLGVTPSMIFLKTRSTTYNWSVYHASVCDTTSKYLRLNDTSALLTFSTVWGASLPTSSVFGITGDGAGAPSGTFVAYCFAPVAGYSAFGSYTGNGSTDGPFVYLGFRPEFVMIKNATTAGTSWEMFDNARETSNLMDLELLANSSAAEGTYTYGDFVSNGFKLRSTNNGVNQSTATLVYMAFAESPFKYALAR